MPDDTARPCAVDPDGHARRVLEFDKVLALVAAAAETAAGRERVLALVPEADPERVRAAQALVAEASRAQEDGLAPWPLVGVHDVRAALRDSSRPGTRLDPQELRRVADTLTVSGRLRGALDAHADRWPLLLAATAGLASHAALVATVDAVVDERGELRPGASPLLRRLRKELQAEREALRARLEAILRSAGTTPDPYVTLRGDRYVIPVRADAAGSVRGIVHDRSASGATLFVEPLEALEANNEIQRLCDAEQREIQRLLGELTAAVAAAAPRAVASLAALATLDGVQARAVWGRANEAVSPRPGPRIRLRAANHPLLVLRLAERGARSVPLDLDLGDARALVVTGPNTGGKTVALKTVGLLALLHQAGVPVTCAADSELPVFAGVVADIGDEQSIESAESTFSSHLRHVVRAVRAAGPATLVLVDELMAGTDPEDGAALAKVVLRRLVERGAYALVTTHLGALKLFAEAEPGVANAGMAFDPETRSPLYRLQAGVPGSSNALAIAARLGLDADLLDAARSERGTGAGELEGALATLEAERLKLAASRAACESAEAEARRIREEHAELVSQVLAKRRTALADARREASEFLAAARARIEHAVRELRESGGAATSVRAAHEAVRELERQVADTDAAAPLPPPDPAGGPPQSGDSVWVRSLGREGILEQIEGGRARVRLGNVTLSAAVGELQRVGPRPAVPPPTPPAASGGTSVPDTAPVPTRLDLRGFERADALRAVEAFLDRLLLQGAPAAEIVHGKGTGVLRRAVQDLLARHPDVESFRLGEHGEGGSGVTIVRLR